MKPLQVLAAVFGVLALASANASAITDSSSFRVGLRIAAPCDVSTAATAGDRSSVTVKCKSASTPYRLESGTRTIGPQAREERADESDGYARATLIF
jgi:hypothetical protein